MKKKKALQKFIKDEEDRIEGIDPRERAYQLMYDEKFIELHHRPRKPREIGQVMGYSEKQIYRFLEIKKEV